MRKLRATGAFSDSPDAGCSRLEPLVDTNVATVVYLDTGLLEPDPGRVRNAPCRNQDVSALDRLLSGGRPHDKADVLSGPAMHTEGLGLDKYLNTFVSENPLHLFRDIGIFPLHQLRSMLKDRHTAPEATVRLGKFEADVPSSQHDEMWWQIVEFQRFNICEWSGGLEARNARNGRVRSDVEKHLVTRQQARPTVIQTHLKGFRRHEAPSPHD